MRCLPLHYAEKRYFGEDSYGYPAEGRNKTAVVGGCRNTNKKLGKRRGEFYKRLFKGYFGLCEL